MYQVIVSVFLFLVKDDIKVQRCGRLVLLIEFFILLYQNVVFYFG